MCAGVRQSAWEAETACLGSQWPTAGRRPTAAQPIRSTANGYAPGAGPTKRTACLPAGHGLSAARQAVPQLLLPAQAGCMHVKSTASRSFTRVSNQCAAGRPSAPSSCGASGVHDKPWHTAITLCGTEDRRLSVSSLFLQGTQARPWQKAVQGAVRWLLPWLRFHTWSGTPAASCNLAT